MFRRRPASPPRPREPSECIGEEHPLMGAIRKNKRVKREPRHVSYPPAATVRLPTRCEHLDPVHRLSVRPIARVSNRGLARPSGLTRRHRGRMAYGDALPDGISSVGDMGTRLGGGQSPDPRASGPRRLRCSHHRHRTDDAFADPRGCRRSFDETHARRRRVVRSVVAT